MKRASSLSLITLVLKMVLVSSYFFEGVMFLRLSFKRKKGVRTWPPFFYVNFFVELHVIISLEFWQDD